MDPGSSWLSGKICLPHYHRCLATAWVLVLTNTTTLESTMLFIGCKNVWFYPVIFFIYYWNNDSIQQGSLVLFVCLFASQSTEMVLFVCVPISRNGFVCNCGLFACQSTEMVLFVHMPINRSVALAVTTRNYCMAPHFQHENMLNPFWLDAEQHF